MIEKQILSYLKTQLDCPVYLGEKPNKTPIKYVLIEVLTKGRTNFIDDGSFSFYSYDSTLQKAFELDEEVKTAMYNITVLDSISGSKLGGGTQHIDTTTKTYACESIFNLYYTQGD